MNISIYVMYTHFFFENLYPLTDQKNAIRMAIRHDLLKIF